MRPYLAAVWMLMGGEKNDKYFFYCISQHFVTSYPHLWSVRRHYQCLRSHPIGRCIMWFSNNDPFCYFFFAAYRPAAVASHVYDLWPMKNDSLMFWEAAFSFPGLNPFPRHVRFDSTGHCVMATTSPLCSMICSPTVLHVCMSLCFPTL